MTREELRQRAYAEAKTVATSSGCEVEYWRDPQVGKVYIVDADGYAIARSIKYDRQQTTSRPHS